MKTKSPTFEVRSPFQRMIVFFFAIILCYIPLTAFGQDNETKIPITIYGLEKIWLIPGWKADSQLAGKYEKDIKDIYNLPVFVFEWDSNQNWNISKNNATKAAEKLSRRISLLSPEQQRELLIIGHSLGARVIACAAKELSEKKIKVRKIIFLGAAVDYNAKELDDVSKISIETPINIFAPNDGVLKYAYGNMEKEVACGCYGITEKKSFKQYSASSNESVQSRGLIRNLENHYIENYCSVLKRIENKDDKLHPSEAIDVRQMSARIDKIMQAANIKSTRKFFFPAETLDFIQGEVLCENEGWKFVSTMGLYAILDPLGRIISFGDVKEPIQKEWNSLDKQINKEKK